MYGKNIFCPLRLKTIKPLNLMLHSRNVFTVVELIKLCNLSSSSIEFYNKLDRELNQIALGKIHKIITLTQTTVLTV